MIELVIDTSCSFVQLALKTSDRLYIKKSSKQTNQAEQVAGILSKVLKDADCQFEDITHIYCVIGPASFTGIRVAIAFVKGLSIGRNIKVIAITNFHVFISNFLTKIDKFKESHILIDCGKNKQEFYYLCINSNFQDITINFFQKEYGFDKNVGTVINYDQAKQLLNNNIGNKKSFFLGEINFLCELSNSNNLSIINYQKLDISKLFNLPLVCYGKELTPLYLRRAVNKN